MYRYAKLCGKCKSKGARNSRYGVTISEETRERMREAARQREQRPRAKRSGSRAAGGQFARRWYELPDLCERCSEAKAVDRHHRDADPQNNARGNLWFLCRRCHQEVDGRLNLMRELGRTNSYKTHCANGHAYSPENTYRSKDGKRTCRICNREAVRRYRLRKS